MTSVDEVIRIKNELPFFIKDVSARLLKICKNRDLMKGHEGDSSSLNIEYVEKRLLNAVRNYNSVIPLLRPLALGNTLNNRIQFDFLQNYFSEL
ncbi:hypothetical protein, partial [Comamonas sp.]|uniref:hypothetical protein n=1 Tax=Comamonas sp. TaxID=34028 RepID=UPI003A9031AF